MNLTANERKALKSAFSSALGNGHDFGFVEDVVRDLKPMKAQAVGALITSLVTKGVIHVHGPVTTNTRDTYTQFTWAAPFEDVCRLVNAVDAIDIVEVLRELRDAQTAHDVLKAQRASPSQRAALRASEARLRTARAAADTIIGDASSGSK